MVNEDASGVQVEGPAPDTAPGVHDAVIGLIDQEDGGTALDAGAGEGALTRRIVDLGYQVEACDLNPPRFKAEDIDCREVDLNRDLPYADGYSDLVSCVETIEHLRDPWKAVSEFGRVLSPGGHLVLTTPNVLSLPSRITYLIDGEFRFFRYHRLLESPATRYQKLDKHINPLDFAELEYILREGGFCVEALAANRYTRRLNGFPRTVKAVYPLLARIVKRRMVRRFGRESFMASDEVVFGEILVVKASEVKDVWDP
jgi:SAM-dependent methyltransferase